MKIFSNEIEPGLSVVSFFMLKECSPRLTKTGKTYLILKLGDKMGDIDGKVWDIPQGLSVESLKPGIVVKIQGTGASWNGKVDLNVTQIREARPDDAFEPSDLYECSAEPPEKLYEKVVREVLLQLSRPEDTIIRDVLLGMLQENQEALLKAPAAKRVHHCYTGGLLEHMLSLLQMAEKATQHYSLRPGLMVAGCVLHDIGKAFEMSITNGAISYTTYGSLIGHISIGMDMFLKAADKYGPLSDSDKMEILHVIASHHGQREWGSPVVPMMREAMAFHLLDMLDSRMAIFDRVMKQDASTAEFTAFVQEFGAPVYKGQIERKLDE